MRGPNTIPGQGLELDKIVLIDVNTVFRRNVSMGAFWIWWKCRTDTCLLFTDLHFNQLPVAVVEIIYRISHWKEGCTAQISNKAQLGADKHKWYIAVHCVSSPSLVGSWKVFRLGRKYFWAYIFLQSFKPGRMISYSFKIQCTRVILDNANTISYSLALNIHKYKKSKSLFPATYG